jgi:hypothetical protein
LALAARKPIEQHAIAIIALRAKSNRLADTQPLMPAVLQLLPQLKPGTLTFVPNV